MQLTKSLALGESSRCFYLRNRQTEQMNTAVHRHNRPICAEEGNKICEDTIMGQRSELMSTALRQHLHCSALQCCCSQFAFILTCKEPGGAKRNGTFLTISLLFLFCLLSSDVLAVQQLHSFSVKYL